MRFATLCCAWPATERHRECQPSKLCRLKVWRTRLLKRTSHRYSNRRDIVIPRLYRSSSLRSVSATGSPPVLWAFLCQTSSSATGCAPSSCFRICRMPMIREPPDFGCHAKPVPLHTFCTHREHDLLVPLRCSQSPTEFASGWLLPQTSFNGTQPIAWKSNFAGRSSCRHMMAISDFLSRIWNSGHAVLKSERKRQMRSGNAGPSSVIRDRTS